MYTKSLLPQTFNKKALKVKQFNDETFINLKKALKLNNLKKMGTNNFVVTSDLNQTECKLQQKNYSVPNSIISGLKNGKMTQVHLPTCSNPLFNKFFNKSKLQNSKSSHFVETLKANKNNANVGKLGTFGQLQSNLPGALKGEKKSDFKHKSFQKGKSLLNQLQKTALLNKQLVNRKNSGKNLSSGVNKYSQRQINGTSNTFQTNQKKSLLEESLLGLKTHSSEKLLNDDNERKSNGLMSEPAFKMETPTSISNQSSLKAESLNYGKHESLERIWNIRNKLKRLKRDHHHFGLTISDEDYDDNISSECLLFQNYWFSLCSDSEQWSNSNRRRDTKLLQLKVELRHKIKQLQWRYKDEYRDKVVELLVESARKQPNLTAFLIRLENSKFSSRKKISRIKPFNLLRPVLCIYINPDSGLKCQEKAMPCIKFCQQHITQSNYQLLFTSCTARKNDNTACKAAVLNQYSENPLCLEHKRLVNKSEMPKIIVNSKPMPGAPQSRKRSKSSTSGSNRSGRSRKRRRSVQKEKWEMLNNSNGLPATNSNTITTENLSTNGDKDFISNSSFRHQSNSLKASPQIKVWNSKNDIDESQEVEVGEEVLAITDLPLELATQATKLLEEHDFTNVLNHIPADAFNDLFTEDKEEYEPTPQETEELERALEAVDKDVKSLEKLSQTQGILDTLLDEQSIAQTLAHLPEVTASIEVPQTLVPVFYQNGFSNINQLEQTLNDVNKSLTQTVLLNSGTEGMVNHFNNIIPNHADVLQS